MNETFEEKIQNLNLNPRLKKIAELIPEAASLADIGTDHAYIPIFACLNQKVKHAIASDIKLGPIARAADNIKKFGLGKEITVRIGPGLQTVAPGEAEVIVIAGMGGILISEILEHSKETVSCAKLLILQPMTAAAELRDYIAANSFTAGDEYLAREDDKLYNIITVVPGGSTKYTEKERILGRNIEKTSAEDFEEYRTRLKDKFEKRISGLRASKLAGNAEKAEEIEQQMKLLLD